MCRLKAILIVVLLLMQASLSFADVDSSQPSHSIQQIRKSLNSFESIDSDGNGWPDKCDSITDPLVSVNTPTKGTHPIQQIRKSYDSLESIDSDGNGWPDVGDSLTEPSFSVNVDITKASEPIQQIRQSLDLFESIDSDGNGWPDKCDSITPIPEPEQECIDSDGGRNYNTKGYIIRNEGADQEWDECAAIITNSLIEYFCDTSGGGMVETYICSNGCQDGVCAPEIVPVCGDGSCDGAESSITCPEDCVETPTCNTCESCDTIFSSCTYSECKQDCGTGCYYRGSVPFLNDCVALDYECSLVSSCGDYSLEECNSNPCSLSSGCSLDGSNCIEIPASYTTQLSQFGIIWTFDRQVQYGQFVNGDYWVVGPLTIIDIDPTSGEDSTGRIVHGSMINPHTSGTSQGYDSRLYGQYTTGSDYDATLNAARPNNQELSTNNPLTIQPGSSLVSTISTPEVGGRTQLQTAAILTVLNDPASEGSFRPSYVGNDKTLKFDKNQLDYSLLSQLTPVANTPRLKQEAGDSRTDSIERMFERPWLDHIPGWKGRSSHPLENMDDYDRDITNEIGTAALMLHLDFTNQEKETLFVRFVQLGIDNYGVIQDGGRENWLQDSGRKFPILFAGFVLNDLSMKNIGEKSGDYAHTSPYGPGNPPLDLIRFEEDEATFYVSQRDVDMTYSSEWNPDSRDAYNIPYTSGDIGLPAWAKIRLYSITSINKYWETTYRTVIGPAYGGVILAVHIMDMKDRWNHDAIFDYKDRFMEVDPGIREHSRFNRYMWDAYRNNYGCTWTRDDNSPCVDISDTNSACYSQGHYDCGGDIVNCDQVNACSDYPNQRALDYDACNLGCEVTASCGDGACNGGETCSICPTDCGICPAICGDGSCNAGETCTNCIQDCGTCPSGDVYYVDRGHSLASDSNQGTETRPWRTIVHASQSVSAGDTVIVRAGDYSDEGVITLLRGGISADKIIFKSEPRRQAKVLGFYTRGSYIRIEGFDITNNIQGGSGDGIHIRSNNVEIVDNYIHDLYHRGIETTPPSDNIYIANNYMEKVGSGINIDGNNWIVENNEINRLFQVIQRGGGGFDADYTRFFGNGHIIRNNYFHGTIESEIGDAHTDCFQTYSSNNKFVHEVTIEGNICTGHFAQGLIGRGTIGTLTDITIKNNIFAGVGTNSWGIMGENLQDLTVVNNVFATIMYYGVGLRGNSDNAVVKNNIFYNSGGQPIYSEGANFDQDYNIIFGGGRLPSGGPNNIIDQDPLFVDASGFDFKLQENSPAIDSGTNTVQYGVSRDIDGNFRPQGSAYDIGAYEFT